MARLGRPLRVIAIALATLVIPLALYQLVLVQNREREVTARNLRVLSAVGTELVDRIELMPEIATYTSGANVHRSLRNAIARSIGAVQREVKIARWQGDHVHIEPARGAAIVPLPNVPGSKEPLSARVPLARLLDEETSGDALDAIALVDPRGQVLSMFGRSQIQLASIRDLVGAREKPADSDETQRTPKPAPQPSREDAGPWTLGPLAEQVTIADAQYRLFSIPLPRLSACESLSCGVPERGYAIVGLITQRRFTAATRSVSPNALAAGGLGLFLLFLAWPFLKLRYSSDRESIRTGDFIFMSVAAVLAPGLLTIALLDVAAMQLLTGAYDRVAANIGTTAGAGLVADLQKAKSRLEQTASWLGSSWQRSASDKHTRLYSDACAEPTVTGRETLFCKTPGITQLGFPDTELFAEQASKSWAMPRVIWRDRDMTPADLRDRSYFKQATNRTTWQLGCEETPDCRDSLGAAVETVRARDEGQKLTIVAVPIAKGPSSLSQTSDLVGVMGTRVSSIWHAVLPPGFSIAVIDDETGKAVLHSQESRALVENVFDETERDPVLLDAIANRTARAMSVRYGGGPHRVYTQRLVGLPWTLLVLRDRMPLALANLQAVLTTLGHFLLQLVLVAAVMVLARIIGIRHFGVRLAFPQPDLARHYFFSALATGFLCIYLGVAAVCLQGPLLAAVVMSTSVLIVCFASWLVRDPDRSANGWPQFTLVFLAWVGLGWAHSRWIATALYDPSALSPWLAFVSLIAPICAGACALLDLWTRLGLGEGDSLGARSLRSSFVANGALIVIALGPIPAASIFKEALRAEQIRITRDAQVGFAKGIRERATAALADFERLHAREPRRRADPVAAFAVDGTHPGKSPPSFADRARLCRASHGWNQLGVTGLWMVTPETGELPRVGAAPADTFETAEKLPCLADFTEHLANGIPFVSLPRWLDVPFTTMITELFLHSPWVSEQRRGSTELVSSVEPLLRWRWDRPDELAGAPGSAALIHRSHSAKRVMAIAVTDDKLSWRPLIEGALESHQYVELAAAAFALLCALPLLWGTHRLVTWIARQVLGIDISPFPDWPSSEVSLAVREAQRGILLIRPDEQTISEVEQEELAKHGLAKRPRIDLRFAAKGVNGPIWLTEDEPREASVMVLRHADVAIVDPRLRPRLLELLERLLKQPQNPDARVFVILESASSPLALVSERATPHYAGDARVSESELGRWASVMMLLRKERMREPAPAQAMIGSADMTKPIESLVAYECGWTRDLWEIREEVLQQVRKQGEGRVGRDQVIEKIRDRAEPFFRLAWLSSSIAEKRILLRLAEGYLVHPRNSDVLRGLLRRGLVVRRPGFRLVSQSFRRFVRSAESPAAMRAWETEPPESRWRDLRIALLLFFVVGWLLIFASSSESLQGLQAYVPVALGIAGAAVQVSNLVRGSLGSIGGSSVASAAKTPADVA